MCALFCIDGDGASDTPQFDVCVSSFLTKRHCSPYVVEWCAWESLHDIIVNRLSMSNAKQVQQGTSCYCWAGGVKKCVLITPTIITAFSFQHSCWSLCGKTNADSYVFWRCCRLHLHRKRWKSCQAMIYYQECFFFMAKKKIYGDKLARGLFCTKEKWLLVTVLLARKSCRRLTVILFILYIPLQCQRILFWLFFWGGGLFDTFYTNKNA